MKNSLSFFVVIILALILQTSLIPKGFEFLSYLTGVSMLSQQSLHLILLIFLYLSMKRDLLGVFVWWVISCVAMGWFGIVWKGPVAMSLLTPGVLAFLIRKQLVLSNFGNVFSVAAILSLLSAFFHLQFVRWMFGFEELFQIYWSTALIQSLLHGLLAPVLFDLLSKLDESTGVRPSLERGILMLH